MVALTLANLPCCGNAGGRPARPITLVRSQPSAPSSAPRARARPPSLDPRRTPDYTPFAVDLARADAIFVGANEEMLTRSTRARAWSWGTCRSPAAKLKALRAGQSVGAFAYFVDSSPKIADVKSRRVADLPDVRQGPGGTFYQPRRHARTAVTLRQQRRCEQRRVFFSCGAQSRTSGASRAERASTRRSPVRRHRRPARGRREDVGRHGRIRPSPDPELRQRVDCAGRIGLPARSRELRPTARDQGRHDVLPLEQDGTVLDPRSSGRHGGEPRQLARYPGLAGP